MIMSNKIVKSIIVLSALFFGAGVANAEDSVRVKNNIYLSTGSEFDFTVFMNKKAKRFVKKEENAWATFNNVVRLYNSSTGQFLKLSDDEKEEFYIATASITDKLDKMRGEEAELWAKKVDITEKVFTFLWNNKIEERPMNLFFELPTISIEQSVGR